MLAYAWKSPFNRSQFVSENRDYSHVIYCTWGSKSHNKNAKYQ